MPPELFFLMTIFFTALVSFGGKGTSRATRGTARVGVAKSGIWTKGFPEGIVVPGPTRNGDNLPNFPDFSAVGLIVVLVDLGTESIRVHNRPSSVIVHV